MPTLEVLWKSFEEGNLMDSASSHSEARVESRGEDSPAVSLVEESDLSNILTYVSVGGEDGEGSAGEDSSSRHKQGRRKKVVPTKERRF